MVINQQIELAQKHCRHLHEGKFRKGSNQPYYTHPFAVAEILARNGYDDPVTQCIALLHDTVEDSSVGLDQIQELFGYEISNGVYILSRNKGKVAEGRKLTPEEYLQRLSFARRKIRRVKIADMIDNTKDLEVLSLTGIERKIRESEDFFIPLGKEIAPIMVQELIDNLENYRIKSKTV